MTREQLKAKFPNASAFFLAINADPVGLPASEQEPLARASLPRAPEGEAEGGKRTAGSFEVRFVFYSQRPCDWDNYESKYLQDCLVESGLLPNDDYRTLVRAVVEPRKVHRKEDERTEVTLIPKP